jgi:recombination associated protein RdgC
MFFTNAIVYKFKGKMEFFKDGFEAALQQDKFKPCGDQQLSAFGWANALGKYGDKLAHFSGSSILICARNEEKILPAAVVNEILAAKIDQIEVEESRPVLRKEKNELKENIIHSLLPQAFVKSNYTHAFIDMEAGLIVVNSATFNKAEQVLAMLRKSLGSLPVVPLFGNYDLDLFLTTWLTDFKAPDGFEIGADAILVEPGDNAATVKVTHHELNCDEVKAHLESDKSVTSLQLNFNDHVTFNLNNDGTIKKIGYSDVLKEENADVPKEDIKLKLDADFILISSELVEVITSIETALEGAE